MILLKRMIVYMKQMINVKLNEINLQVFMLDQAAGTAQLQVQYFELLAPSGALVAIPTYY